MKNLYHKPISIVASLALFAQLAGSLSAPGAMAADLNGDQTYGDQAQETTQVEYGTGWYLRGEISLTAHDLFSTDLSEAIVGTTQRTTRSQNTSNVFSAGIGMGYRFSHNFRADINLASLGSSSFTERKQVASTNLPPVCANGTRRLRHPNDAFMVDAQGNAVDDNGNLEPPPIIGPPRIANQEITDCYEGITSSYDLQTVMGNVYYDFDSTFLGMRPFVGVGAGLIRNNYSFNYAPYECFVTDEDRCSPTDGNTPNFGVDYEQARDSKSGVAYHLAGSVTLGGSYPISENLYFDTMYTYTKMIENPLWGGDNGIADADIPTNFHSIKVGLRLEIW